ncbi:hypothetical protein CTEN210_17925 [Chaetoceros tenuissimus]|uniref:ER membrane protein complex subunit 6 n=1 Tax=Chaetoceros tenuissimus TaxID=426638 RepID=A0AAD3DBK8_9STRA|nr:hypothetical protein CTEN210_17925 [Chaetoceros tenuissimus]
MIDPMANIGGQPAAQGGPQGTDASTTPEGEVFDFNALQRNMQKMESIRSFMGIINGCCAGILGLTNTTGIVFFVTMHMAVGLCIWIKMNLSGGSLAKYRRDLCSTTVVKGKYVSSTGVKGIISFLLEGLQNCFMSYMLFWTLFYGLVYLF